MKPIIPEHPDPASVDLIDAYLRGELDPHAKVEVDVRRTTDPEFDDLFVALLQLSAASRAAHLEGKMHMLRTHAASQPKVVKTPQRRQLITRIAAAAVILVLIAAGLHLCFSQEHSRLYTTHFTTDVLPGKGELSTPPHDWKAYDHYARGQYAKAAKEFDELLMEFPDSEYLLHAAVSHLGAGHHRKAELLFNRALEVFPENTPEIIFYQALMLVRRGDATSAKALLDENASLIPGNAHLERLHRDLTRNME